MPAHHHPPKVTGISLQPAPLWMKTPASHFCHICDPPPSKVLDPPTRIQLLPGAPTETRTLHTGAIFRSPRAPTGSPCRWCYAPHRRTCCRPSCLPHHHLQMEKTSACRRRARWITSSYIASMPVRCGSNASPRLRSLWSCCHMDMKGWRTGG
ncbi:uncharacterized protein LOC125537027 isoform X1 [Triticum urartu]|uniref:Uncharacterized protein n=1 Tax=Triticum urartu TaxID=4572 RepID=A0A8R7PDX6_TRIUA|nr:uncharacterized protein LOC125537027 isoform X1 [Triticum urartu]